MIKARTESTIKLLSIDGGGVRGIIPAQILYRIEKDLNVNVYDTFDVFTGSSIGSIITSALVYEKASGKDLIEKFLNRENMVKIMYKSFIDKVLGPISLVLNWPKYSGKPKRKIISDCIGDKLFSDTDKKLIITSYDVVNKKPKFFRSWDEDDKNLKIVDVVDASTAAPFFFPAVKITHDNKESYYIDGSISCNNPTNYAYSSILEIYNEKNNQVKILSLGTGNFKTELRGNNISKWGGFQWIASGNISLLISGFEQTVDYCTKIMSKTFGDKYLRIDYEIENDSLDDVSDENIDRLIEIGNKWFEKHKNDLINFFS